MHHSAGGAAFFHRRLQKFASGEASLGFGVAGTCTLSFGSEALFDSVQVLEDEFRFNHFDVADRVHRTVHVDDVFVVKAAHHFHDGFAFADVGEELVAETFALGSAFYKACNVHEFCNSRDDGFRVVDLHKFIEAGIRDADHADVRIDGAERIVGGFCACVSDCVEDCALAYVREAYDAAFKTHDNLRFVALVIALSYSDSSHLFLRCKGRKLPFKLKRKNLNLPRF